ncbi:MAG: RluA family pseudouridine synthase [Spirochaetia bacterium]|nr:RluA family pseudouridine synthase [Spirochaetia bacterium]
MQKLILTVEDLESSRRADCYIAENSDLTRSRLKADGCTVRINGTEAKLSKNVCNGDEITVEIPDPRNMDEIVSEPMDLDIIYEDDNVIVLNKQQGVVVHPAAGNFTGTLVNGLLYHSHELEEEFEEDTVRPGIVHRLDKDTSGVLIVAKNAAAHEFLSRQFRDRVTCKTYVAIVRGKLPSRHDMIETYLTRDRQNRKKFTVPSGEKGKFASTEYTVIKEFDRYTYCSLQPHTGRTHQLRVHMQYLNVPILGDPLYSRKDSRFPDAALMLHARRLEIFIPGVEEKQVFEAPVPQRFLDILSELEKY